MKQEIQKIKKQKPSITEQFKDLKQELGKVTVDQWMNIPDIGDYTIKKQKREKFTPTPDNIITQKQNQQTNVVQEGITTNLNEVGMARSSLLTMNLDKFNDKYVVG